MGRLSIRRQFGIMALAGACAFMIGGMAAFASGGPVSLESDAEAPALATSVVHITATAPAFAGEDAGFVVENDTPPFGYTYVIYFPVGGNDLTAPARETLEVVAAEVTGLDLSHISLASEEGPLERTQVVRDALVEMGVPARWIGEDIEDPDEIGPISMVPMGF